MLCVFCGVCLQSWASIPFRLHLSEDSDREGIFHDFRLYLFCSEDSISLCLDDGTIFVGDLNLLYGLELHKGTQIEDSWEKLLTRKPKIVYYGHARKAELSGFPIKSEDNKYENKDKITESAKTTQSDKYSLVMKIMGYIDKGISLERIQKKTGADSTFIEDVTRMYLTHKDVGVQGILDRIEIKGR